MNVNGKVDKRALPEVDVDSLYVGYVAPSNDIERGIVDAFEMVFNQENGPSEEMVSDEIRYPYQAKKRTVVFGGHETWLKAFKPKFSNVRFVDASQYSFAPEVIRNADVVWIQNNRISHSQYYAVVNTARQYGIQVRYFPFASADKCAELLVREDRE